jgi:hypothetical protein
MTRPHWERVLHDASALGMRHIRCTLSIDASYKTHSKYTSVIGFWGLSIMSKQSKREGDNKRLRS